MHEVRVESLEGLERTGRELRLSANGGTLSGGFGWRGVEPFARGSSA